MEKQATYIHVSKSKVIYALNPEMHSLRQLRFV